jgi:hypothetical protein
VYRRFVWRRFVCAPILFITADDLLTKVVVRYV